MYIVEDIKGNRYVYRDIPYQEGDMYFSSTKDRGVYINKALYDLLEVPDDWDGTPLLIKTFITFHKEQPAFEIREIDIGKDFFFQRGYLAGDIYLNYSNNKVLLVYSKGRVCTYGESSINYSVLEAFGKVFPVTSYEGTLCVSAEALFKSEIREYKG